MFLVDVPVGDRIVRYTLIQKEHDIYVDDTASLYVRRTNGLWRMTGPGVKFTSCRLYSWMDERICWRPTAKYKAIIDKQYPIVRHGVQYMVKHNDDMEEWVIAPTQNVLHHGNTPLFLDDFNGRLTFTGDTYCYIQGSNVTEVDLGIIAYVEGQAFLNCPALTSIIGNDVRQLGSAACVGCHALTRLHFPYLRQIYGSCFEECTSLSEYDFPRLEIIRANGFRKSSVKRLRCTQLHTIDERAFAECDQLQELISARITTLGVSAFIDCFKLVTIDLHLVSTIPDWTFSQCKSLVRVRFADNVVSIGAYAFGQCDLRQIDVRVKRIEAYAFQHNYLLKTVILSGLEHVDPTAFSHCNIEHVSCPHAFRFRILHAQLFPSMG